MQIPVRSLWPLSVPTCRFGHSCPFPLPRMQVPAGYFRGHPHRYRGSVTPWSVPRIPRLGHPFSGHTTRMRCRLAAQIETFQIFLLITKSLIVQRWSPVAPSSAHLTPWGDDSGASQITQSSILLQLVQQSRAWSKDEVMTLAARATCRFLHPSTSFRAHSKVPLPDTPPCNGSQFVGAIVPPAAAAGVSS